MRKFLLAIIALVFFSVSGEAQRSWRVNNIPGIDTDFTSLATAVSSASAGDTLYVESSPNNYSGNVNINKKLFIYGTGYFLNYAMNEKTQWNKNDAYFSSNLNLNAGSSGTVISGLRTSSIYLNDSAVTIERCHTGTIYIADIAGSVANNSVIKQNYLDGSVVSRRNTSMANDILFHNNLIRSTVDFRDNLGNTTAYFINNDFTYHNGIYVANSVFQNNVFHYPSFSSYLASNGFYNNICNNTNIPSGDGNQRNVNLDNLYVNFNNGSTTPSSGFSPDGKYQLKPGSVAAGAGDLNGTPVDIGAFGGPAPYVLSGMPPIPSIYQLSVPNQVNAGVPTMTISISASAH